MVRHLTGLQRIDDHSSALEHETFAPSVREYRFLSESSEENKLGSASSDDEELGLLTESDDDETPVEFDRWGSLGMRAQRVCIYCPCCLLGGVVQLHWNNQHSGR
jgi:hypothetical protein